MTAVSNGWFYYDFGAADADTLGALQYSLSMSTGVTGINDGDKDYVVNYDPTTGPSASAQQRHKSLRLFGRIPRRVILPFLGASAKVCSPAATLLALQAAWLWLAATWVRQHLFPGPWAASRVLLALLLELPSRLVSAH